MSDIQLYRPDVETFNIWTADQIYTGDANYISMYRGGVVPNVGDHVIKHVGSNTYNDEGLLVGGGEFYYNLVHSVDPVTKLSTLVPIKQQLVSTESEHNLMYAGLGGGRIIDADRIYVNENNLRRPYTIDWRIRGYGISYYKIFDGSDLTDDSNVISVRYSSSGEAIGDSIPVELVDDSDPNKLVYRPADGNLKSLPKEGTPLYIVAYSEQGNVRYWQPLVVYYSAMVADMNSETNYITGIHLESPYLVAGEENMLQIPINFLNNSLITSAYVDYKSGSKRRVTIGTEGMALRGWDQFADGSFAGQERSLILTYQLGPDETAPLVEGNGENKFIPKTYKVTVAPADSAYNVKLFVDVVYISPAAGYNIRYYLMNLERNVYIDVTNFVTIGTGGTGAFQPQAYNVKQILPLKINLKSVNPAWPDYLYLQTIELTLNGQPAKNQTPYLLNYIVGGSRPYGAGIQFTYRIETNNNVLLDLTSGLTQYADWLDQFYYKLLPMFDVTAETEAPSPTKLRITYGGGSITVDTINYNIEVDVTSMGIPAEGELCYLEWFKLDSGLEEQMLARATVFIYGN